MKRALIILLIVATVIVLFISLKENNKEDHVLDTKNLYEEFAWEEISHEDPRVIKNLYADGRLLKISNSLTGTAYRTVLSESDTESFFKKRNEFYKHIGKQKDFYGWQTSIELDGATIMPTFADGGGGSYSGFVKLSDDNIYTYQKGERWLSSEYDDFGKTVCPCEYEIIIFESDPIEIGSLTLEGE